MNTNEKIKVAIEKMSNAKSEIVTELRKQLSEQIEMASDVESQIEDMFGEIISYIDFVQSKEFVESYNE